MGKRYILKHKDYDVLSFEWNSSKGLFGVKNVRDVYSPERLPFFTNDKNLSARLFLWISERMIPITREGIKTFLQDENIPSTLNLLEKRNKKLQELAEGNSPTLYVLL